MTGLISRMSETPASSDAALKALDAYRDDLRDEASREGEAARAARALIDLFQNEQLAKLVAGTLEGSPYLRQAMRRSPERLFRILTSDPDAHVEALKSDLKRDVSTAPSVAAAMPIVRRFKAEAALLTALCDIGGVWPVMRVTEVLSHIADAALQSAVALLFRLAIEKGDWKPTTAESPEAASGYFVLALGKYGAFELNYSSDIDLIVFYEAEVARAQTSQDLSTFFVRLTRDLVRLMDERTADGYVFRTDLRLRPDAGATQIALSTDAALAYYEGMGQNWERAALIKARACAGDRLAGSQFLADVQPFIWRRNLDFGAIADIQAMKRQIHAVRGLGGMTIPGHNLKLGAGGIREIEFFAQGQQLILGGRHRNLRSPRTLEALMALEAYGWTGTDTTRDLTRAYLFLRRLEHRVQMVADEQTHELPEEEEDLERLVHFSGFSTRQDFDAALLPILKCVNSYYTRLFERDTGGSSARPLHLVVSGGADDPETLSSLTSLGFKRAHDVLTLIKGWHQGRYPALRSERARTLLSEMQGPLVTAFAGAADPDRAIMSFDQFLGKLPAGVQLFSLLKSNPALLKLLADIMGTAPRLAQRLSRSRRLLDAVIDPRTAAITPDRTELDRLIRAEIEAASDMQDLLDRARVLGSEQAFLIGVKVLTGEINATQAGHAYAVLAESLIAALATATMEELERAHGRIKGGEAAVIAMGKLGGREMTASSDLDLIVLYDFTEGTLESDGTRPLAPSTFYARFTQRLITALSAPTAEGMLYDVDMRLRPSGQKGPVAAQLSTFRDYQEKEAWTWEHLALTRARVIWAREPFKAKVEAAIRDCLTRPRDRAKTAADVLDMRTRIIEAKGTSHLWDLKQIRGGLVDLEFIAQYQQLIHGARHPDSLDQTTLTVFRRLGDRGLIPPGPVETLIHATSLVHNLTQILRLCIDGTFDPETAPEGLKALLARAGDAPDFPALEASLKETLAKVETLFAELIT